MILIKELYSSMEALAYSVGEDIVVTLKFVFPNTVRVMFSFYNCEDERYRKLRPFIVTVKENDIEEWKDKGELLLEMLTTQVKAYKERKGKKITVEIKSNGTVEEVK